MSIELVMPSNHLIFCHPRLLPASLFPSIRFFSNESVLCIRWPKSPVQNIVLHNVDAAAKSLQSCPTLCDPIDSSPPGSPIPGILQARILSGLPFPSPMHEVKSQSEVSQSCLTLSNLMDCSLPGSSVHGIFQARVLEWGAIAFSA